jgi:hypothetical protein
MMTRHEFLRAFVGLGLGLGVGASALAACGTDTGTGDPGGPDPSPDANTTEPVDGGNPTTPVDAGNPTMADASTQAPVDAAPQPPTCSTTSVVIGGNHGHSMQVAAADLNSTASKMYAIQGTGSHPHTVTITPAQFAMLKTNGTLTVMSSTNSGHPHSITVSCA